MNRKEIIIEILENGYYYETIIEEVDTPQVISAKATFTYDGTTSKCVSCIPSAKSYISAWTIKSVTLTCTAYGVVS